MKNGTGLFRKTKNGFAPPTQPSTSVSTSEPKLMQVIAKRIHAIGDPISRTQFLTGQFRVCMQIPTKADHLLRAVVKLLLNQFEQVAL